MALLRDTKARAKRIDLAYFKKPHAFRRWRFWLSLLVPALGAAWLAAMAVARDERLYTSGGLSARHASLEKNCKACHGSGWGGRYLDPAGWQETLDRSCLACHDGPLHHANAVGLLRGGPGEQSAARCSHCHVEHEGAVRLAQVPDAHCTTCHADLKTSGGAPKFDPHVRGFGEAHPEFGLIARKTKDPSVLKFNHAMHLKPEAAPKRAKLQEDLKKLAGRPGIGPEGLGCAFCHAPSGGGAYLAPVHYETHCMDCHGLRFEGKPLPHEPPGAVRDFLRSFLAGKGKAGEDLAVAVIEAESPVYTSDAVNCSKCHAVKDADDPLAAPPSLAKSGLRPGGPADEGAPRRWFRYAFFNHETHRMQRCADCHGGVEASKETSDLLLPGKASCVRCHSTSGGVAATCVTCHTYHDQSKGKR